MAEIKPDRHSDKSKKEQVEEMFDSIASKYDFLNRFLSLGIDRGWRTKGINMLRASKPKIILDLATGTGDFALAALKLNPDKIVGLDISQQMLDVAKKKIKEKGLENKFELLKGEAENLPFADNSFDAITIAFGVRNFGDLDKGLKEMNRVLKAGSHVMILEFSKPKSFPYKQIYNFYFKNILPFFGNRISKSKNAYSYLPESVDHFPEGKDFASKMAICGFKNIIVQPLTFGTCSLYFAEK